MDENLKDDPIYFINNYCRFYKDKPIALNENQEKLILNYHNHRFNLCRGDDSVEILYYILYKAIFVDFSVACILTHKMSISKSLLYQLNLLVTNLPEWFGQKPRATTKTSLDFVNGSTVIAASGEARLQGQAFDLMYVQPSGLNSEFRDAVFPTIIARSTSKLIISSHSCKYFEKLWAAENSFVKNRIL